MDNLPREERIRARHRQLVGILDLVRRRLEALEVDEHEKEGDECVTCGEGREGGRREQPPHALLATSAASRASHRETAPAACAGAGAAVVPHCCTSVPLPPANTAGPLPCGACADVGEDEELEQQRRAKVALRRADQREGGDERKDERRAKLQPVEGLIRRHDFDTTSEDHGTHDLDSQVGHLTRVGAETSRRPAVVPRRRRIELRRKEGEDKVGGGDTPQLAQTS